MRMRAPKQGFCEPIPPLELPHCMHAYRQISLTDTPNMVRQSNFAYCFLENIGSADLLHTQAVNRQTRTCLHPILAQSV